MKNWQISRRAMLKGVGAMLSLPWLEAMKPWRSLASDGARAYPVRLAVLYMPNGVNPHEWTPKGMGSDFELSPILEPLRRTIPAMGMFDLSPLIAYFLLSMLKWAVQVTILW
jgi:hypothetical protein